MNTDILIQNYKFENKEEIIDRISKAESGYKAQTKEAAAALVSNPRLKFITLTGPTCSGKTTTASRLTDEFASHGHHVKIVSIDDFFRDNGGVDRHNAETADEIDYDSVEALDLCCFRDFVSDISEGRKARLPEFDFLTGLRKGFADFEVGEGDVVLFEGVQASYPEIISLLPHDRCGRLFVSVEGGLQVCGSLFTGREIRLVRRIVRDFKFRGASPEFTMFLWGGVVNNEEKNIYPYYGDIPVKVNTLLSYELNIIKRDFLDIMSGVSCSSRYFNDCAALVSRFDPIPEINIEYLPEDSVYREFLG